jgi:DNA-binding GntR family transcriptional regulator
MAEPGSIRPPPKRRSSRREPSTLVDRAADSIREEIFAGRMAAGSRIHLLDTADALGTSPIPVREALHRLVAEDLVDRLPQRGFRVRTLSLAEFDDLARLREMLDPLATRLGVSRMKARDLQALEESYGRLMAAAEAGDRRMFRRHHRSFHFGIYNLSDSPLQLRILELLWNHSERYRILMPVGLPKRSDEHKAILDACRRGDLDAAEAEMLRHLQSGHQIGRQALGAHLEQLGA